MQGAPSSLLISTWGSIQLLRLQNRPFCGQGKGLKVLQTTASYQVLLSSQVPPDASPKPGLCYPFLHNLYCCKIPKPGVSITKALDTTPGLFFLDPVSLHPHLKHLFSFSVSPAALLLHLNEWDQARKYHASLNSYTDPFTWLMAWCDQSSPYRLAYLLKLGKTFLGTRSSTRSSPVQNYFTAKVLPVNTK